MSDNPHTHLPARMASVGDEFWFQSWLWEVALVEVRVRKGIGPMAMIRARSIHRPHHYATIALPPEQEIAYLYKEYA